MIANFLFNSENIIILPSSIIHFMCSLKQYLTIEHKILINKMSSEQVHKILIFFKYLILDYFYIAIIWAQTFVFVCISFAFS